MSRTIVSVSPPASTSADPARPNPAGAYPARAEVLPSLSMMVARRIVVTVASVLAMTLAVQALAERVPGERDAGAGAAAESADAHSGDGRGPGYHRVNEIDIPGDSGWDYASVDSAARRLYITHGTHIVVIDVESDRIVGDIPDTPGVHGFAIAPAIGRGFSSNGKQSTVSVVDLKTLALLSKVSVGEGPDAIVYEPGREEVYAFDGRAHAATVIGARSARVVAEIALPGKPEFAVADPAAGRVYANIEDKSEVVSIDTGQHRIVDTWPIAPGETASGLALDADHHRLFIGCDNHLMVMMDAASGRVVGSVPIGAGVDANAFDPGTQLAFSSNGEGSVTIAKEVTPERLVVAQTLSTQPSARTLALDPRTHKIYLPAATPASGAPGAGGHHAAMQPGSFKVLVYAPAR